MLLARNDGAELAKGWYNELFHPSLPAIGFATQGINEPHYHRESHEVYLVVRGSSTIVVNDTPVHPSRRGCHRRRAG